MRLLSIKRSHGQTLIRTPDKSSHLPGSVGDSLRPQRRPVHTRDRGKRRGYAFCKTSMDANLVVVENGHGGMRLLEEDPGGDTHTSMFLGTVAT